MRKFIKSVLMIICVCSFFLMTACGQPQAEGSVEYNFSINANEVNISVGQEFDIFATYGDLQLTYTSLDENIATVSQDGKIKGVSEGTTFIQVASEKAVTNVKVVVKNPKYELFLYEDASFVMVKNAPKTLKIIVKKDGVMVSEKLTFSCEKSQVKITALTDTSASIVVSEVGLYQIKATHASGESLVVEAKVMAENATKLQAPSVKVEQEKVTWNVVENASAYMIKVGDSEWKRVENTAFDVTDKMADTIYVYAVCDTFDFYDSAKVSVKLS